MNRRNVLLGGVLVLLIGLVAAVAVRSLSGPPANRILVAGDVRAVVRTVSAPALTYPNADYTVSVPSNPAAGDSVITLSRTTSRTAGGGASAGRPIVSGTLVRMNVQVGDHVTTGQVVAQLGTKLLDLGIEQAKLNASKTKTTVRVLKNSLDTIADNQDKVATGKDQLATGRQQLEAGAAKLRTAKAQLLAAQAGLLEAKRNRPLLRARLAQLKQQAAKFPPGKIPPGLLAGIKQLTITLASINPGLKKVNAGLAQLATAEATLAAARVKLATAADQLATASDALKTAKKQVVRTKDSLEIIADAAHISIALAQVRRDQATITSPISGTVTQAAAQGSVAMVGAPIVRIQPDEPTLVDTYLTGSQLGSLKAGAPADITYDSGNGKDLHGTLALIGDQALFPPTSFPTDIVHMTRTVKVTFRLDSGDGPPAGTPVDIAIHTD